MNIVNWWYSIVDSWFSMTVTIGIAAMIIGVIVSAVKFFGSKGTSND